MRNNATGAGNQQGSLRDPSETTRRIPQINKELAQLLGFLFTDGCVSPKGVKSWRIYFSSKSESLVNLFRDCMVKVFNLDQARVRLGYTSDGFHKAIVDSKEIGNFRELFKIISSFFNHHSNLSSRSQ